DGTIASAAPLSRCPVPWDLLLCAKHLLFAAGGRKISEGDQSSGARLRPDFSKCCPGIFVFGSNLAACKLLIFHNKTASTFEAFASWGKLFRSDPRRFSTPPRCHQKEPMQNGHAIITFSGKTPVALDG